MTQKKKSQPVLRVVFDTNVLFTQVASDLVKNEIRTFIGKNASHNDIAISWYLPEIVVNERRYQMESKAFELLQSITKLEKLLGHNLNITKEILVDRVDKAIKRQLEELNISSLTIDTSVIDWNELIKRSVNRHPPFEPGEKEKGFRDCIIAESFRQLVLRSPSTPSIYRLVMITDDNRLMEYLLDITKDSKNVKVFSTINELESLINTLISEVTEDFLLALREKIDKYFFDEESKECLLYKEHIIDKINEQYSEKLKIVPQVGFLRENGTWYISKPVFIKKEKQRLYWMTPIRVEAQLYSYKYEFPESAQSSVLPNITEPYVGLLSVSPRQMTESAQRSVLPNIAGPLVGSFLSAPPRQKVKIGNGQSTFEIDWSVIITPTKKITRPRIENIRFISTTWNEK